MYAIAFQMQCNCIPIKSNDCNNNKKGLPGNPHIAHFAHYKKRSPERHETKSQMLANFLAKQMKNTQTSHDIKKGYFIFVGGRKWKPIKKGFLSFAYYDFLLPLCRRSPSGGVKSTFCYLFVTHACNREGFFIEYQSIRLYNFILNRKY